MDNNNYEKKRVWDIPTRVFHWSLVMTVCIGWWLGENLDFDNIQWHFYLGYTTGGLILFRIVWGFIGPEPVKLRALIYSPGEVVSYLRNITVRKPSGLAGHNPIGALSVIALLTTLGIQVITGLFSSSDELFSSGPLSDYASESMVLYANSIHGISAKVLLALVILHIVALLFYLIWKRENLIKPMITGLKYVLKNKQ